MNRLFRTVQDRLPSTRHQQKAKLEIESERFVVQAEEKSASRDLLMPAKRRDAGVIYF